MARGGRIFGNTIAGTAGPRPGRLLGWALVLGGLLGGLLGTPPAWGYCRSTTCSQKCAVDDDGCKVDGKPLAWAGGCIGVSLQRDGTVNVPLDRVSAALDRALATWSALPCPDGGTASVGFARLQNVACDRTEFGSTGPNANAVIFRDNAWRYAGVDNTLGFTTVTFSATTGEILGADIEVNSAFNELTTGDDVVVYDLQSILTHELGHLLGLGHSSDPDATMLAEYNQGETGPRDLSGDDVDAICAVYSPARAVSCDPTPRGGFASACVVPPPAAADDGCALGAPGSRTALPAMIAGAVLGLRWARRRGRGAGFARSRATW